VGEYERHYRESATDLELMERVFYGGMDSNQLRAALWPYLFGLVKHRGRFKPVKYSEDENQLEFVYVEHEQNVERWQELEKLYLTYQSQWKSIMPDQELRFSTFRERKSLIERDVIRSDRSHPFYADNSQNLTAFTTLLMTYMMYDFDIGYLQGMSDLAAPILYIFNGDLVKSFWVFVEVMKLFRRNFEFSQKTIHFQLNCLFRLIRITDPRFANYLKDNECSNCFFTFRCIVCQFKRELMRNNEEDDYSKVLSLWDTIWSVQRRHELLTKSKYIHTYTIANGHSTNPRSHAHSRHRQHRNKSLHQTRQQNYKSSPTQNNDGYKASWPGINPHNGYGHSNGHQNGQSRPRTELGNILSNSCNVIGKANGSHKPTRSPTKSFGGSPTLWASNGDSHTMEYGSKWTNGSTMMARSPSLAQSFNSYEQQLETVKQEEILYTKETCYSAFDPNQADVQRVGLTETEKFVLALCLSLIRRERNHILLERLDASEIHQHFINPQLANDLDNFIESAYHIYNYLNTDCDLQFLIKGANETDLFPEGAEVPQSFGMSPKDETADTYELLRDYLIISPSSHGTSHRKSAVLQKSWDHFINTSSPLTD